MSAYVNLADESLSSPPPEFNGFLSIISVAVSKSGAADGNAQWDRFVRSKLLPTIKLQSRDNVSSAAGGKQRVIVD